MATKRGDVETPTEFWLEVLAAVCFLTAAGMAWLGSLVVVPLILLVVSALADFQARDLISKRENG